MFAPARLDVTLCLRCQLRRTLYHITSSAAPNPTRPRCSLQHRYSPGFPSFSTSTSAFASAEDGSAPRTFKITRPLRSHGRLRGKKGAEQREASEPLAIGTLGRPSEVIILRDVVKRPKDAGEDGLKEEASPSVEESPAGYRMTAKEIESFAIKEQQVSGQEDVNASIEEIRQSLKGETMLPKADFHRAAKAMAGSYNVAQLSRYFNIQIASHVSHEDTVPVIPVQMEGKVQQITRTQWHRGTTPIERRLSKTAQLGFVNRRSTKAWIVDKILRDIWGVQVEEEIDAVGELEILLQPSQVALLQIQGIPPQLGEALTSTMFYRRSTVQSYPPDNALRITGPPNEVEARASLIEAAFQRAQEEVMRLKRFSTSLGILSSPKTFTHVFSDDTVATVSRLSQTHLEVDLSHAEGPQIRIFGFSKTSVFDARRLILSLLPLPTQGSSATLSALGPAQFNQPTLLPYPNAAKLPYRYHSTNLERWAVPAVKVQLAVEPSDTLSSLETKRIASMLLPSIRKKKDYPPDERQRMRLYDREHKKPSQEYWETATQMSQWDARVGHALYNSSTTKIRFDNLSKSETQPFFAQTQVPGLVPVLSYCEESQKASYSPKSLGVSPKRKIVVQLIPRPLRKSTRKSPNMEMTFSVSGPTGKQEMVLVGIKATIQEQVKNVLLPQQTHDLQLRRQETLAARIQLALHDPAITEFVETFQQNLREHGVLRCPPDLDLRVPNWVVSERSSGFCKVPYMFRSLEHSDSRSFVPIADISEFPDVADLAFLHKGQHEIHVKSAERGLTGGNGVEVSIRCAPRKDTSTIDVKEQHRELNRRYGKQLTELEKDIIESAQPILKKSASMALKLEELDHAQLLISALSFINMLDRAQRRDVVSRELHEFEIRSRKEAELSANPEALWVDSWADRHAADQSRDARESEAVDSPAALGTEIEHEAEPTPAEADTKEDLGPRAESEKSAPGAWEH